MYNDGMTTGYEIRVCDSCGLRYPLVQEHPHGTRCPVCMGGTRVLLSRELIVEPTRDRPDSYHREEVKHTREKGKKKEDLRDPGELHGLDSLAVLLDNIRSAWNVGSILRSADGFGFAHAYLCGISPTPDGPAREAVTKTSLGAEDSVPWSYHKDAVKLVRGLKAEGWKVFALEEGSVSVPISQLTNMISPIPMVLIFGNEVSGVDPELLDLCNEIFYIPMRGEKKSFNVAMAFSIAAYAITSQRV